MRKYYIFMLLILPALLISCDEEDREVNFNLSNRANFTVESSLGINTPLSIPTPDVNTSSEAEFANNKTKPELIKDIRLNSLKLTITSPQNKTFSFLKSIDIYISAAGLPEVKLASKTNIGNDVGNSITLDGTGAKLDEYIKKSKYTIRSEVVTDETLFEDVSIEAFMIFGITAELF